MCPAEENTAPPEAPLAQNELIRIKAEHANLEAKISELESLRFPTDAEETQIKQLKREKLSLKEKMEKIQLQRS
ncbi:YdcH family protein [Nitrospinota bacterium]